MRAEDSTPLTVILRNHFAMLAVLAGRGQQGTSFQRAAKDFEATPEVCVLGPAPLLAFWPA